MHVANGATFGAAYANLAPRMPLPAWARGPAVALVENIVLWPLTALTDRVHPARDEMPKLGGNRAALLQATWRHLLFGVMLGELERRLNPPQDEEVPAFEHVVQPERPRRPHARGRDRDLGVRRSATADSVCSLVPGCERALRRAWAIRRFGAWPIAPSASHSPTPSDASRSRPGCSRGLTEGEQAGAVGFAAPVILDRTRAATP